MSDRRQFHEPLPGRRALTGREVFIWLAAFFGVVFAVNGVFLAKALSTYSGVVSEEPYVKGLQYNSRIAAGERQAALAWREQLSLGRDGSIALELADQAGNPISGLVVHAAIGRPATSRLDHQVALVEQSPGHYAVHLGALEAGTWLVDVKAARSGAAADLIYRLRRRQWLKP